MISPFANFSNRKSIPFQRLFYEYELRKKNGDFLFGSFQHNENNLSEYDFALQNYQSFEDFKNHTYTYKYNTNKFLDFYGMALGFKKAARESAELMVKDDSISALDTLFFAMVYLYRQSVELLLKARIFQYANENEQKEILKSCGHDLVKLYEEIKANFQDTKLSNNQHLWIHDFLYNISEFDRASDSFRYPYRITRDLFGANKFEYVFKDRRNICLIKLVNKFETVFALILHDFQLKDNEYIMDEKLADITKYDEYSTDFLEEGTNYYAMSAVGYQYNKSEISMYSDAYKNVADHLFKLTLEDSQNELSYYYFKPICYLYQNAIELGIKNLCFLACSNNSALEFIRSNKHNNNAIWRSIKDNYYQKLNVEIPLNFENEIEKMLAIFTDAQITTSSFRYPVGKDLQNNFKDNYKLHIGYVYSTFQKCLNLISGLNSLTEIQADLLSESHNN